MNLVALTGLFGMAIAKMGMLSTTAYVLTMDMFGPIAYNAGGMVEMSQQAIAKGFAMGSVVLASFLLFSAYMDEVTTFAQEPFKQLAELLRRLRMKKEDYLLREYKERPDYGRCVVIIASASLQAIIKPAALDHIINTCCLYCVQIICSGFSDTIRTSSTWELSEVKGVIFIKLQSPEILWETHTKT
ncbi:hypothetical protein ACOSQ4_021610 [Xanthoceras sorbifolium]